MHPSAAMGTQIETPADHSQGSVSYIGATSYTRVLLLRYSGTTDGNRDGGKKLRGSRNDLSK